MSVTSRPSFTALKWEYEFQGCSKLCWMVGWEALCRYDNFIHVFGCYWARCHLSSHNHEHEGGGETQSYPLACPRCIPLVALIWICTPLFQRSWKDFAEKRSARDWCQQFLSDSLVIGSLRAMLQSFSGCLRFQNQQADEGGPGAAGGQNKRRWQPSFRAEGLLFLWS